MDKMNILSIQNLQRWRWRMMVNGSMTRERSKCRSTSADWFYKFKAKNKFLTCSFAHSSTGLEDHWWGCFLSPLVSGWWLEAALIFCCCGLTWWALRNCGGMIPVSVGSEKTKNTLWWLIRIRVLNIKMQIFQTLPTELCLWNDSPCLGMAMPTGLTCWWWWNAGL